MLKNGLFLSAGNVIIALVGLARNIVVARLIGVEDFGIAATFAITMALVEMTSNMGFDRLLVQARNGGAPALQATVQSLQAARGALGAVFLFLIAEPLAGLFGVPDATWAYQLLAFVPLMRGLVHLDMFRAQREMRFGPSVSVELTAIAASTMAAVPLGLWLKDYRVMLYVILLHQGLFMVLSHIAAERPYRWGWDRAVALRAISFGWPLLFNGLLMFGTFQGDRIIVGSLIGLKELGWFSAAFTLTLAPTLVMAKTLNRFFLPLLSKTQDDPEAFHHLYLVTMQAALLGGVLLAVFFVLVGPALVQLFYGPKFAPALPLVVWLAVMQGVRMMRQGPSVVAISAAQTRNPLVANTARIVALPVALVAAAQGFGITGILIVGIIGEIVAMGVSTYLLARWSSQDLRRLALPFLACTAVLVMIAGNIFLEASLPERFRLDQIALAASALMVFLFMPELRRWTRSHFRPA